MRSSDKPKFEFTESTHLRGMPPAAGRERGVVKMIKYETTRTGLIVNYSYAFISPDSGPESPDVFLHPTDVPRHAVICCGAQLRSAGAGAGAAAVASLQGHGQILQTRRPPHGAPHRKSPVWLYHP